MFKQWDKVFGEAAAQMRPFNDYLIYDYRPDGIDKMPIYWDKMFHQVMDFFGGQMDYVGYRRMTPEERIDYVVNNQLTKGNVSIRRSEMSLWRYEFNHKGDPHYIYIYAPVMINNRILYNDTEYYPQFPIVEKGGVNRTSGGTIIVKVMRVPITFGRRPSDKFKIISMSGKTYPELLVTVKIHQGKNSGKKSEHIPLILYRLCKFGYVQTMTDLGMKPDDISISDTFDAKDTKFEYFSMPDGHRYLKVKASILENCYKRRMVLSLYRIFQEFPEFQPGDAFGTDVSYYCTVLGKFIGSKDMNVPKLLLPNAVKHLQMTDPMLDLVAKEQLETVGCKCNDIYDLLLWMYYNIDDLLVSYDPTNLFDKKIESMDNLASRVARNIATHQYLIINSKKAVLDEKTCEQFCKKASQRPSWFAVDDNERSTKVFRPSPSLYNDNFALSIGLKRILSFDSVTSPFSRKNKKSSSKNKTSPQLLKAHYSQLIVTAITDIPASSPVETGSLSPWCETMVDGSIVRPPYADEIVDVFK